MYAIIGTQLLRGLIKMDTVVAESGRNLVMSVNIHDQIDSVCSVCVCVFSSHPFWTSSSLDVPAGVTQEEGHTGFLTHLPSACRE